MLEFGVWSFFPMNFTPQQQQAMAARGNVLVIAGAGTGKTRTLVERCLSLVLDPADPVSLEEILMVTFTEAAAAEMRQRIRLRLEEELVKAPKIFELEKQLALFDTAHIGTLHGFCLKIVRQHFYELELDPQLAVLPEEEARLLADETLDEILQSHYAGGGALAEAVQGLIQTQGRGWDKPVRALVAQLHNYTQTLPDPAGWFAAQIKMFECSEPVQWREWLDEFAAGWRASSLEFLNHLAGKNELAAKAAAALEVLPEKFSRVEFAGALERLAEISGQCPPKKKTALLGPLKEFFAEAEFLRSLVCAGSTAGATPSSGLTRSAPVPGAATCADQPLPSFGQSAIGEPGCARDGRAPAEFMGAAEVRGSKIEAIDLLSPALSSLGGGEGEKYGTPLTEDWNWSRTNMLALLRLAEDFGIKFAEAKLELGALDFHDLEQHTLLLLWDGTTKQPTAIAREWREKLRFVFVDEYQDINAAQDKIIEALSRDGAQANRFLVGDIKQSIYRFRLANPRIFQNYAETWGVLGAPASRRHTGEGHAGGTPALPGCVIPLTENFRSREGLINFVNSLFSLVMQREAGGLVYDEQARLRFGAAAERYLLGQNALAVNPGSTAALAVVRHALVPNREAHDDLDDASQPATEPVARAQLAAPEAGAVPDPAPRVELHLRFTGGESDTGEEDSAAQSNVAELEDANKEARLVALRLRELKTQSHQIWDEKKKSFRAVEWSDMSVLLRSPGSKAEIFAKEFSQLGVPLVVARGGFFASLEISDLLNLLRLLDNPLQDLPALAVLHSPLVGLTVDELATIRLAAAKVPFWTAVLRWRDLEKAESGKRGTFNIQHSTSKEGADHVSRITVHGAEMFEKVDLLLARFARWRRLVRQVSLSRCLEAVLSETHFTEGLLTLPRGEQRRANVQRLLNLAQQFDQFQRQGLFRFLRFVEAQQAAELEPEVAAVTEENAVRLMSIHQSKGLEFPVVAVANLAKPFNFSDVNADIILDEKFGLCPQIKPPHTGRRYPSLPHWLARRRQKIETLGEELRLLYVATTRARDTLILTASITEKKFASQWQESDETGAASLLSARSYADWMGIWFAKNCATEAVEMVGRVTPCAPSAVTPTPGAHGMTRPTLSWKIWDEAKLMVPESAAAGEALNAAEFTADEEVWDELERRLTWQYPYTAASGKAAKVSVSTLRREAADEEAGALFQSKVQSPKSKVRVGARRVDGKSAADIGTAHHKFLQGVALEQTGDLEALASEAKRLEGVGILSAEEVAVLDFKSLAAFWQSELGLKIRAHAGKVHRELAFTARFSLKALAEVTGKAPDAALAEEFVVVQGVADLAVVLETEIWLVDFKTDDVGRNGLDAKVKTYEPQLRLYASALARIYRRPVMNRWLYFLSVGQAVPVG